MTETSDQLERAAAIRAAGITPQEREAREEVRRRNEGIQAGVVRGPNAHPDGTFGKLKK